MGWNGQIGIISAKMREKKRHDETKESQSVRLPSGWNVDNRKIIAEVYRVQPSKSNKEKEEEIIMQLKPPLTFKLQPSQDGLSSYWPWPAGATLQSSMRYQDRVPSNRLCQKEKSICSFSLCTRTFLSHRLHSSCVQWSGSRETDVVSRPFFLKSRRNKKRRAFNSYWLPFGSSSSGGVPTPHIAHNPTAPIIPANPADIH